MDWIAVDVHIAGDPAVHRLAAALRIRLPEVVGLLALTFAGMAQHAPDGQIGNVPDALLETWALWHGKKGVFAAALRVELCDDAGLVTAWEKYNGRNIRRARAASERTRDWREKQEAARQNGNSTHTDTHNRARTETILLRATGQDSTKKKEQPPRAAPRAPDVDAVIAHYRGVHPARRPGEKDRKAVGKALGLGYSVPELCEAIDGNAADPWHREKGKHELPYVLRDNGLIDNFRAKAAGGVVEIRDGWFADAVGT